MPSSCRYQPWVSCSPMLCGYRARDGSKSHYCRPPAQRPNPGEVMRRTCMDSACPQKGVADLCPRSCQIAQCPCCLQGSGVCALSKRLSVETRQVHILQGADFGWKETRYVRGLLGRRRDFLYAEAEWSCEAMWEDIHRRSMLPDTAHNKTFSFQAQLFSCPSGCFGMRFS